MVANVAAGSQRFLWNVFQQADSVCTACLCFAQSQVLLQGTIGFYDFHIDSSSPSDLLKCPGFRNLSPGLLLLVLYSAASQQPQLKVPGKRSGEVALY